MASFNLGKIKGDTGSTGMQGPKGDKGDKGERGESGYTPLFSIKETQTLPSGENARVEIDSSLPENPELSFFIPKGQDGKDALGDMLSTVYDPQGLRLDIFNFAQSLSELSMKKTGGTFTGKVYAYSEDVDEACVRNIVVAKNLPENAINGDIGIMLESVNGLKLQDQQIGTIVLIEENGVEVPYIIVSKDYHKEGTYTLIRKHVLPDNSYFDHAYKGTYKMSTADLYLEAIYAKDLTEYINKNLVAVDLPSVGKRRIFLPQKDELTAFEYFTDNSMKATIEGENEGSRYWTRNCLTSRIGVINVLGQYESLETTEQAGYRPLIVLDGASTVENTTYESAHAVKLQEKKRGIYVFDKGVWKECSL